jgi:tRNA (guanine-N7-)-methyltransferase
VPKRKIFKYADIASFPNVLQPGLLKESETFELHNKWADRYFKNSNPIVAEFGCGRGEYTVGLASKYPHKNFIGIDIKGDRLWMGASRAREENLTNVCFLRTQIEPIEKFFSTDELSEIWIAFPDPQPNKAKKRLTSPLFLSKYANILKKKSIIHLKTDDLRLFKYTLEVIKQYNHNLHYYTYDLYNSDVTTEAVSIKTYYESIFLEEKLPICYLKFSLNNN